MDETKIKPRPGRLGRDAENSGSTDDNSDKTQISSNAIPLQKQSGPKVSIFKNSLLEAASDCLSLAIFVNQAESLPDLSGFKHRCTDAVKSFEFEARDAGIPDKTIFNARYCLCALLDESVLNSRWSSMEWAKESLLSIFHKETFGGEYFYTLIDESLRYPEHNRDFLELQYHCLNLGFKGKFRVGNHQSGGVEDYRNRAYNVLNQLDGPVKNVLSPDWERKVANGGELRQKTPLWVVFSILGALGLALYLFLNTQLNDQLSKVDSSLASIHPIDLQKTVDKKDKQLLVLEQLLQTEIQKGIISIQKKSDRIRLTINNRDLFKPGEASLLPSVVPILQKLALSLEGTKGRILITGYTDDTPIKTAEYPSNWLLSLARANEVANAMAKNTNLSGRLWPEGRGAADPIAPNTDSKSRAMNRRVEIDLLF
ncbi:putative lipoprotein YiaD precursor [Marinomonas spartinae]|uniref:Putative lipoprotein YiaD n=1 Tax=Marinomonas spartinae TaxID=1792290 RepID=A0A1A8TNJ3_9GAMM|nr:type VI secretion system protein TssL, long form [Marinomonas spartinae]SBS34795.1 putative lipoprotein YiaD precursor [Marinomonas spartinae]SBS38270.1 putative lipoprotein YiaD precursor [Marinomonas spartinae]